MTPGQFSFKVGDQIYSQLFARLYCGLVLRLGDELEPKLPWLLCERLTNIEGGEE